MDPAVKSGLEPGIATLVGGIVNDGQRLIEQQFILLRREVEDELRRLRNAVISMAMGAGTCALGGLVLVGMFVHLLNAFTDLPLWGCYGVVGGGLIALGAMLLLIGGKGAASAHVLAPPQTTESLKENVAWLKHQTNSESI
jgi:hypothetical protein